MSSYSGVGGATGSFTTACTGPFASTLATINWTTVGKIAVLSVGGITPTGNSTSAQISMDMTNIPAAIRPVALTRIFIPVRDNGADVATPGVVSITTSGAFTIWLSYAVSVFTSTANTVGFNSFSATYVTV